MRILISGAVNAGHHKSVWDGKNAQGVRVASGIYLYRLEAQDFVANKKLGKRSAVSFQQSAFTGMVEFFT